MKSILFAFCFLIHISVLHSQTKVWNNLLQKFVNTKGEVDYRGLSKDSSQLDLYLTYLAQLNFNKLPSKKAQKALWINAYNAYTIKLILDNYPLTSIKDIKQNKKNAWEIPFVKVASKTYTLNYIEHEILRKQYKDPKIHVGVNCASVSCPALPNVAFTENNIDELLTKGMLNFINNPQRNVLTKNTINLSQIFNWFLDDFTQHSDLITFINQYSKIHINPNATINYLEYNWTLNSQK
ncbi:DUF547 domain-containing protein [Ochrovirga pacifica]|uniref:DUF547 domain-containing protein n=1 Tax=Ochrovirga pacifica TaxID=1042376 RepID=UPI0002559AEE|nr:DUF547 domain-containing protein [Ochrovirga pacifica]